MKEHFILPDFSSLADLNCSSNDRIVVIAIVGKTSLGSKGIKCKAIDRVFTAGVSNTQESTIEGYFDEENQIVFLHLHSLLDTDLLCRHYEKLAERCEVDRKCDDFLAINDDIKSNFARALLFLFHVSHIVVLSHPGSSFDTSYIQYFKAVDALSQKLYGKITDNLRTIEDLNPDWVTNGRMCIPRVIFHFDRCPRGAVNLKKVEHNMEDRIYHILKKTRIVTTYGSSLFAIPLNEEFVFVAGDEPEDRTGEMIQGLIQDCDRFRHHDTKQLVKSPFCSQPCGERNFLRFLQVHVNEARTKGFYDLGGSSNGRHHHHQSGGAASSAASGQTYFELPTLKHWTDTAKVLHKIVMRDILIQGLCTDTRFSDQRCLKVLPLAVARYQEGLPPHYGHSEHDRRLSVALALFNAQARGPSFQQYVEKLKVDCQTHWENGRQQCEAASMTGNPCKMPKHAGDQEHMSGFVYKALCDCGRKVGPREDPYNVKQANYSFYRQLAAECVCAKLEKITFPVFQPSIKEYKAATLKETEETLSVLSDRSGGDLTPDTEKTLTRQPSTTEYLPGMLTLSSPASLLPVYSSWSLVCLGPSSLYSHNLGLSEAHHPGFLSSTNYLLPWDVTVYSKTKPSWSHVSKFSIRGRRGRPAGTSPQFSVKVFIGVEYECPSGHRFMLAGPDKVLKATPGSIVKDTGHKIAESDMPLYHPCMCRANKMAQLMRLHVVTPKAPVYCTLDPKVQPAPGAPVFIPTTERPTKLTQSAYWVMRLPYVYVADKEHYQLHLGGKLLMGVFGVTEIE